MLALAHCLDQQPASVKEVLQELLPSEILGLACVGEELFVCQVRQQVTLQDQPAHPDVTKLASCYGVFLRLDGEVMSTVLALDGQFNSPADHFQVDSDTFLFDSGVHHFATGFRRPATAAELERGTHWRREKMFFTLAPTHRDALERDECREAHYLQASHRPRQQLIMDKEGRVRLTRMPRSQ